MSESLAQLLLRLSEAGEPAILWGRQARRHLGRDFDRFLRQRLLVEQPPATEWQPCSSCDCDLDARPIEEIDGRLIAICPYNRRADTPLAPDDLRSFHIDVGVLAEMIGTASGFSSASPVEILPGVWRLGVTPAQRVAFLIPALPAALQPGLMAALRATARGAPITLVTPPLPIPDRHRLEEAGLHLVVARAVIDGAFRLDMVRLAPEPRQEPRLIIISSTRTVVLDGIDRPLSDQPYRLFVLLAERARQDGGTVPLRDIERSLWGTSLSQISRPVRDVVRELRDGLALKGKDQAARALVESSRNPNGYRLSLTAADIDLRP